MQTSSNLTLCTLKNGTGREATYHTHALLLQKYTKENHFLEAKSIHANTIKSNLKHDTFLSNLLINMYVKSGNLQEAKQLFDEIPNPNTSSWNAIISGYSKSEKYASQALQLHNKMKALEMEPNNITLTSLLSACSRLCDLQKGMQIHQEILKTNSESDLIVGNAIINMYAKCGNMRYARQLFDKMPSKDIFSYNTMIAAYVNAGDVEEALEIFKAMPSHDKFSLNLIVTGLSQKGRVDEAVELFESNPKHNVVSWNAMIRGYAKNGDPGNALELFRRMVSERVTPCLRTFVSVLQACSGTADSESGMEIHGEIVKRGNMADEFVESALVDMYAKCGRIQCARRIFEEMDSPNQVSWSAIISGYVKAGYINEAVSLFKHMPQHDIISCTALISGFMDNGLLDNALDMFYSMPQHDATSWTAMISGFIQNGQSVEALRFFKQMRESGVCPRPHTFVSVISACTDMIALEQGMEIHGYVLRRGFDNNGVIASALLDMYAKCGDIIRAERVFQGVIEKSFIPWSTMISGYAMHGQAKKALEIFVEMQKSNITPSSVNFVCVLSACCHAGLVNEGMQYYNLMIEKYNIVPATEHCACIVDLLGRAGFIHEALGFINKMPIEVDVVIWRCLLGACRVYKNLEIAEVCAERVFMLNPSDSTPYVVLGNMYAEAGLFDKAGDLRRSMKEKGISKTPGYSWIEIGKQLHVFLAEDS